MVRGRLSILPLLVVMACATSNDGVDQQQPVNWAKPWMPDFTSADVQDQARANTAFDLDALYSDGDCTMKEQIAADAVAGLLDTPKKLLDFFRTYAHCDDGGIAEGISESVTILLDSHWNQIVELAEYAKRDPTFGTFVASHVDETADDGRVTRIRENARTRCPEKAAELCKMILAQPRD